MKVKKGMTDAEMNLIRREVSYKYNEEKERGIYWADYIRSAPDGQRKERIAQYYKSATWHRLRNRVLIENEFICAGCGKTANEVHHEIAHGGYKYIGHGDYFEMQCVVPVCKRCHNIVTCIQNKDMWWNERRAFLKAFSFGTEQDYKNYLIAKGHNIIRTKRTQGDSE
jgi:5-methylcytosine-specific restriction endonuclease McrA